LRADDALGLHSEEHAGFRRYPARQRTIQDAGQQERAYSRQDAAVPVLERAARLGVMLDIQPAWLYLDTHTLAKQFGYERLRYFQPLRSLFEAVGLVVIVALVGCKEGR